MARFGGFLLKKTLNLSIPTLRKGNNILKAYVAYTVQGIVLLTSNFGFRFRRKIIQISFISALILFRELTRVPTPGGNKLRQWFFREYSI